jgi:hypothetical protein
LIRSSPSGAQAGYEAENSAAQKPQQIEMTKTNAKFETSRIRMLCYGFSPLIFLSEFVSDFVLRISDFVLKEVIDAAYSLRRS